QQLEKQMREAAKKFEFERAAELRDRIRSLKQKDMAGLFSRQSGSGSDPVEQSSRMAESSPPGIVMIFKTDRLVLSTWQSSDWIALRPIASDAEVMRYITGGVPWTDERIQLFVNR